MRTIAIINNKGGVGKTTTCVNLAHALALSGRRVLAMDLDPQEHLGTCLGYPDWPGDGMDRVLLEGMPLEQAMLPAREDLMLVPAGPTLGEVEHLSEGGVERGRRLLRAIETTDLTGVDYVLLDCPPSAGLLAVNALFAAGEVLVPMPGDYLALQGLAQLTRLLQSVARIQRRDLTPWVALTRYVQRRRLTREVLDKLMRHFPDRVLATPVREAVALAEAPSFGQTIFEYRANSHGAEDYRALAQDLDQRRTMT